MIAAQGSMSTINGLNSTRETDRNLRGDLVRYNWDIQIIGARDNDAKVAGRFIFENQDTLDYWIQIHPEHQGMNNYQVLITNQICCMIEYIQYKIQWCCCGCR